MDLGRYWYRSGPAVQVPLAGGADAFNRLRGSKLKDACRRRVVEAGPRDLDLLQLADALCSEVLNGSMIVRGSRVQADRAARESRFPRNIEDRCGSEDGPDARISLLPRSS